MEQIHVKTIVLLPASFILYRVTRPNALKNMTGKAKKHLQNLAQMNVFRAMDTSSVWIRLIIKLISGLQASPFGPLLVQNAVLLQKRVF
jgi:uncharacterized membrane protein